jgi:hypothetical protein
MKLCELVPGAIGAVIQDYDGESVDYYGPDIGDEDLQINAAQWGLVWRLMRINSKSEMFTNSQEIIIQTTCQKIIIKTLYDDYYLVLILGKDCHLLEGIKAINLLISDIKKEMGL